MWTCDAAHSNSDFIAGDHLGNDAWAERGTPVAATVHGVLVDTGYSAYSGNKVSIETSGNWYHFMCHLDPSRPGYRTGESSRPARSSAASGTRAPVQMASSTSTARRTAMTTTTRASTRWQYLHAVEHNGCP